MTRPDFYAVIKYFRLKPSAEIPAKRGSPHKLYDRKTLDLIKEVHRRADLDGGVVVLTAAIGGVS